MSLHWGTEKCASPLPADDAESAWRECLIFGAMMVGQSRLTAATLPEWQWRIRYIQRAFDDTLFKLHERGEEGVQWHDITVGDLTRWLGLWTNASTYPRKEWLANICRSAKCTPLDADATAELDAAVAAELAAAGYKQVKRRRKS